MDFIKRDVLFKQDLEPKIKKGVDILADAVKSTMGPKGSLVLIQRGNEHPTITKDGVTVAQSINLADDVQNLGAKVIKEAASRTAEEAGDGTTTSTVLAQKIYNEGIKMQAAGYQQDLINEGIQLGLDSIKKSLKRQSRSVKTKKELIQVALISANGEEEIAKLIVKAINSAGADGSIIVEEAKGFKSDLTVVDGFRVERGYLSPYFVTDKNKMTCDFDKPLIVIANKELTSIRDIMKPLEIALENSRPILVIANEIEGEALQGIVLNKIKGALRVCAIKSPGFGNSRHEMLHDIQSVIGGTIIDDSFDMSKFTIDDFGTIKKAIIHKNTSMLISDNSSNKKSDIEKRIEGIKERLEDSTISKNEKDLLGYRLQQLSGGIAIIRIGAATESELIERNDRVDDALNASKAAIQEGIIPGGGISLVKAASSIEEDAKKIDNQDIKAGLEIMKRACFEPFKQIIRNGTRSPESLLEQIISSKGSIGYDARKNEISDMFDAGIVDPHKVVRCAIENATSAASMLLNVGCCMVEIKKHDNEHDSYI